MKKKHLPSRICALFALLTSLAFHQAEAQISINQSDLLGLIGNNYEYVQVGDDSVTVNVGSPGANQVWDLRNIAYTDTLYGLISFAAPASTPHAAFFPQSNFVIISELIDTSDSFTDYEYGNVETGFYITLGSATDYTGTFDTTIVDVRVDTNIVLPLNYGNTWSITSADTTEFIPGSGFINLDTTTSTVDGWGTVRLEAGDFACLRIREESSYRSVTVVSGQVLSDELTQSLAYIWLTKDNYFVASINSQDGETDPNFTVASNYFYFKGAGSTGIADRIEASGARLLPIFPNPVSGEMYIPFELEAAAEVAIRIQNLHGSQVATVLESQLPAGPHQLAWSAAQQLPAGMYLCTLTVNGISQSRKIVIQ